MQIRPILIAALLFAATLSAQKAEQPGQENDPVFTFGTTSVIPSGLRGAVYAIKEGTSYLPEFDRLKPLGYLYTNRLNIPTRQFSAGFPGITGQANGSPSITGAASGSKIRASTLSLSPPTMARASLSTTSS